jgi:hypothetical protein
MKEIDRSIRASRACGRDSSRQESKGPGMLWNLDSSWLLMAIAVVTMISYPFGLALHGVMGSDGFGPLGNMIVVATGFFLGILTANSYGLTLRDLTLATGTGLAGAGLSLGALAMLKAGLNRMLDRG